MKVVILVSLTITVLVIQVQGQPLFVKHFYKKILSGQVMSVHAVKGALHCEKLCLDMGDACKAVNVIYTHGTYECWVMTDFPYSTEEVKSHLVDNPMGKLIIKQGMYNVSNVFQLVICMCA